MPNPRAVSRRFGALRLAVIAGLAACGSATFVPPPPTPNRVYGASEVDERPEIVLAPPLHYPEDASLAATDGVVIVRLEVDTAGNPVAATAHVVATPDSGLGSAGLALVLKTLFRPARVRGRVVRVLIDVPVEFAHTASPPVTLHIAGDVYTVDDVQERPRLTSGPPVIYPAPLLLSRISGRVIVEAIIDTTGRVEEESVRVVDATDPRFNDAAKAYTRSARYTPGRVAGRAVRVRFQIPVDFRLPSRD
ncbi:MAG TPA: energy transducer TonB [Gemmatimonadales bacterium]|nr:energy transducer TonB [Gemmatimonadales bacterium]